MEGIRRVAGAVVRAPFTRRARRELCYCAAGAVAGVAGFFLVVLTLVPALAISASVVGTVAGLLMLVVVLFLARRLGTLHRLLLRRWTGDRLPAPAPFQPGTSLLGRLDRRLRDREGWRAVGYAVLKLPVAIVQWWAVAAVGIGLADITYPLVWVLFRNHPAGSKVGPLVALFPVPYGHLAIETLAGTLPAAALGPLCVIAGVWLARGIVVVDQRLARALLGPGRVSELERTRAIAVEDAAAALRRVERDLHDGAQVRLAAVTMNLGMALDKTSDSEVDRGHQVCAAVGDGEALLAAVREHGPDAVIADIRMPPSHTDEGLRAAEAIRRDFPSVGVLVFSQYVETRYTSRLLESGAGGVGYLLKDRVGNVGEFVSALERVASGGTALDPEVVARLLRRPDPGLASLTPREREVLGLMAEGRSNSGIAAKLVLSDGAVEKHIASIFGKLGLESSAGDNRRVLAVLRYLGAAA